MGRVSQPLEANGLCIRDVYPPVAHPFHGVEPMGGVPRADGVLRDEDERVREFAWRAFAVAGPDSLSPFLPTLQTITQDPTFVALPYVQETLRKLPQTKPARP